jgi:hypothetical protein
LSFPEREGGPCACTVDRSSPTLSPSSYNRLQHPTTRSNSSLCYRKALLKTPYPPKAGPFPLSGGHNVLCPSLEGKGDRAHARWMGPAYTLAFVVQPTAAPPQLSGGHKVALDKLYFIQYHLRYTEFIQSNGGTGPMKLRQPSGKRSFPRTVLSPSGIA